jgi:hypothetical protein
VPKHDIAPFNRLTGATLATHLTLVKPGDAVIGVSASHSHPSVLRAAAHVGARFTDTAGLEEFKRALDKEPKVALVDMLSPVARAISAVNTIQTIAWRGARWCTSRCGWCPSVRRASTSRRCSVRVTSAPRA